MKSTLQIVCIIIITSCLYVIKKRGNVLLCVHRDQTGQTPYIVAPDKDTRNVFRKYMADHPDRYNYSRALVSCRSSCLVTGHILNLSSAVEQQQTSNQVSKDVQDLDTLRTL